MASSVVVYVEERSLLEANAPTATAIRTAFIDATAYTGRWVGPAPRVTRVVTAPHRVTRAAWLATDDTWRPRDFYVERLQPMVEGALRRLGGTWTVAVYDFNPVLNGTMQWWESGQAAVTQTRDQFSLFDSSENPIGPTTPATRPTTPGDVLERAEDALESFVQVLGVLVVGGGIVYAAGPPIVRSLFARRKGSKRAA